GGGTKHDNWMQMRADAFGMKVRPSQSGESALTGAALAACIGLGIYKDIAAAQSLFNAGGTAFVPNPERTAYYDTRVKECSNSLSTDLALLRTPQYSKHGWGAMAPVLPDCCCLFFLLYLRPISLQYKICPTSSNRSVSWQFWGWDFRL